MAASTTIANITDGTNSIDITFYKLEHDYDKQLIILSVPKATDANNTAGDDSDTTTQNPLNYNIDIQRLKQVITMNGYLLEESGSTALSKKTTLEKLLSGASSVNLSWLIGTATVTKTGQIIKCKITEQPGRIGDNHPSTQGKSFLITLQFGVGQFRG